LSPFYGKYCKSLNLAQKERYLEVSYMLVEWVYRSMAYRWV